MTAPKPIQVDPERVLQILQETHPDAFAAAAQRARAEQAEARIAELEAALNDTAQATA